MGLCSTGGFFRLLVVGIMLTAILGGGCSHIDEGTLSQEANQFFNQGNYGAALGKYEQLIANYPAVEDRVLFEMGIVYAYPRNAQKDYRKSLDCFQKIVKDYPDSEYRYDSQMMILQIHNVIIKDQKIAAQQAALETSRQALEGKADEIVALQEKIEALEETVFTLRMESADKVMIEKQARRLSLLSKGEVIKTYKIALGGNPVGPKERQGDNKTPEGTYHIDARNGNSGFHLSLHISYPNEHDKKRAKKLGVSPGGDIMIHGIKNGFSQVGVSHAETDWTEGCIAVTNQEMEEIYKFVPIGTVVEITP
ncbi:MAG: L,D-transpeptidase family protein [Desulfobacteraceae bacterium]|nr:L,D-transpeptidase family protein [Desulfobacteraceae bacterium]